MMMMHALLMHMLKHSHYQTQKKVRHINPGHRPHHNAASLLPREKTCVGDDGGGVGFFPSGILLSITFERSETTMVESSTTMGFWGIEMNRLIF